MPRIIKKDKDIREVPPSIDDKTRENQLISFAIDLAEEQLRNGTASSQVITHFLKLGSSREKLEQEVMEKNKELIDAKKDNLRSIKEGEERYRLALEAMRSYSGLTAVDGDDDDSGNRNF